jgi:hypothetical protein
MDELQTLTHELSVLIEKIHSEYQKYFTGAEKLPPAQQRDQLEKKLDRLRAAMRKTGSHAANFQAQNTLAKYAAYRALWDKRLAEREKSRD